MEFEWSTIEIVDHDETHTALPECLKDGDRWHIDEDTQDYIHTPTES